MPLSWLIKQGTEYRRPKSAVRMQNPAVRNRNPESRIQNPKSKIQNSGTLYVVATPLGNLEDMTLRALEVLKAVDLIAAETVSHSRGLCQHYGIRTMLMSYNQHNQKRRGPELVGKLKSGLSIALVTNAGTPGVSDPGVLLTRQALAENIRVIPVPGPSAVASALSVSGLRGERFVFMGFLSNRSVRRRKELKDLISEPRTTVFFEAPHRLRAMLMDCLEILGDREMVLVREMSKVHEEVIKGSIRSILNGLDEGSIKGEFTLVLAGKKDDDKGPLIDERVKKRIEKLLNENIMSLKDVAERLSQEEDLPYRKVYKACLTMRNGKERRIL
jgi:16S rRNA (cytidine1402-2'-O)-methyltransferase